MQKLNPFVLIILDGFGYREAKDHNAIAAAKTPYWDKLWRTCPHMLINGSGSAVGLPQGQMGNSEVGHLNLGAGRIVPQEFTRIQKSIAEGSFASNSVIKQTIHDCLNSNKALHIMGLLSAGGVHSHEDHIFELIKVAANMGLNKIYLHAFLDGRDTAPKCALESISKAQSLFATLGCGQIASLIGRYYAMDRDKHWDRIQVAYELITHGKAAFYYKDAKEALLSAYERSESDEFVQASAIYATDREAIPLQNGDSLIFMNFRADRARQLTQAFADDTFDFFDVKPKPKLHKLVTLTQYSKALKPLAAFSPQHPKNTLGECIAKAHWPQLRIAETEKYAHVTFFFNGGIEEPFPLEERQLIASPNVKTYDLKPQMSAPELTEELVQAIQSERFALIVCNYANPDMVGHTGNFAATVKAIECIDASLKKVCQALQTVGGQAIITADHGNAERMFDHHNQQCHTAHTSEPVPLVYVGKAAKMVANEGALCDIAPTILSLLNQPIPKEMSHNILIQHEK